MFLTKTQTKRSVRAPMLAVVALSAVASCANTNQSFPSFFQEAGSVVDPHGSFGEATLQNIGVQNGSRSYVINLGNRFANEVPSTVNFAFNSAKLDEQARTALRRQADWIRQFPEVRFRVYGHTDQVGSNAYNKRLGLRRARAVVSFLASQGIHRSRLEAVASFGETQPVIDTPDRERRNRRTVTEVSGFVDSAARRLNGQYAAVIYREYITSATAESALTAIDGSGSE
ncbi:MAG: OmpA family protein [Pseudomonadota bacterium]|nr:OmpA family protein [Pseudomonadota bacterium]